MTAGTCKRDWICSSEGYEGILVEERQHAVDELLDFIFVIALVQPIQYHEKWALCQRPDSFLPLNDGFEWCIDQVLHPDS